MKKILIIAFISIILSSCGAKVKDGGYVLRNTQIEELQKAKTKSEVIKIAGSPSSKFDKKLLENENEIWLYSSYHSYQTAFFDPVFDKYDLVLISFDDKDNVISTKVKQFKNKEFLSYSNATTEFEGQIELGLISELFGNIGAVNPLGTIGR